jgi:hypothetical protein
MKYILRFGLLIAGMCASQAGCGPSETTGLTVGFSFEGTTDAYASGFTGFVAFDEGTGPVVPIRRKDSFRKGFMDRPTSRVAVQDPVFGVQKGIEVSFSPLPKLATIYVGNRKSPSKEWAIQAFAIKDLKNSTGMKYLIPVAQLGPEKPQIDKDLHAAVVNALNKCDQESTRLQNQEPSPW